MHLNGLPDLVQEQDEGNVGEDSVVDDRVEDVPRLLQPVDLPVFKENLQVGTFLVLMCYFRFMLIFKSTLTILKSINLGATCRQLSEK